MNRRLGDQSPSSRSGGTGHNRSSSSSYCSIPSSWRGVWFQSGVRPYVSIDRGGRVSTKGRCVRAIGKHKFVFREAPECYRCLVIHQRAHNVLQYKESE